MSDVPTIELRRYPSRKIYNKTASSYVRLPEVAEMVRAGANVRVEDTETGEDVTRQVLLQIIMEQENHADQAILSSDLMMDMIRMHQSKASEMMTGLFEQSIAFMRAQQEQIASQMSSSMTPPWSVNVFDPGSMAELQRQYQQKLAGFWGGAIPGVAGAKKPEPAPAAGDAAELQSLRERLEELERKLGR
ncbi:MAG: polyhydroxyalkanoate synthesis regulator DNA-binding domain-containing protein [Alphaproteobacteria bacterium]|nr:polyhydroxyalkanoate synthesis regulator DNA-binding domain-containing protein [Alphaproteobacteria bacterium]